MTLGSSLRLTLASLALFSSLATAQTRFCLGGNLATLSEAERASCRSQLQGLRESTSALPQGEDWHVVLVCGKQAWQEYQDFTGSTDAHLTAARYDVNLDRHEIFLRSTELSSTNRSQTTSLLREAAMAEHKSATAAGGE